MSTILRQRIKGFRTRPLSLSASNIKSTQCLREIIHEGTEARVMTADLSQFSPVYDNLIDELGNDEAYSKWNWAGSKPAKFDFGEFGNVRIKGSPDAIFEGIPVELKTVKSSLGVGATREKIQAWSLQCAAYQLTHGNGSEGVAGPAILLIVSLEDLEVLALNVGPDNFARAKTLWLRNLSAVFGGSSSNLYRKYWENLIEYQNHDSSWRAKHHHSVLRKVIKWQEEDAERELSEGMALIPRIWEAAVAQQFERKVNLGRKLCLKGRKSWQAKKDDRTARKVLNGIVKDTRELFDKGNKVALQNWVELKRRVEGGGVVGRGGVEAVKAEVKVCLDILGLMKTIARWRDVKKELAVIEKAMTEIKVVAKGWVNVLGGGGSLLLDGVGGDDDDDDDDDE
ncbi:hypothetical protein TrLO_g8478 [Triparma laevis f. longispina]|uniref:Uncharacterized protein n=1 Tax=Triparma laevis f. longispina TaxID=1714387 RepID=A0A9W7F4I9_9STRA|nr:hypothetical protein TrLO_g8478 [Triparma laevis f. longispina]